MERCKVSQTPSSEALDFSPTPLRGCQEWVLRNGSWKGSGPQGRGDPLVAQESELWLSTGSSSGVRHNWSISYGQSESNTQTRTIGGAR